MLPKDRRTAAQGPGAKRRFRITKLEERIAPSGKKNGWDNPNNPHYTENCTNTCFCTIY